MTLEELKRDYEAMSEDLQDVAFSDVTAYITALEAECERLRKDRARLEWLLPRQYDHQTRESIDVELSKAKEKV